MTHAPHLAHGHVSKAVDPIVVTTPAYNKLLSLLKASDPLTRQKIKAIKFLREEWEIKHGSKLPLRDAKHAVERLIDELDGSASPKDHRARIVTHLSITAVVVNTGVEKVEVDLEELQLRILSEVNTLGLAECGRILELVEVFQAWNEGYSVGILKSDS